MEKIWFCRYRAFFSRLFVVSFFTCGVVLPMMAVEVEVKIPMKGKTVADVKKEAEKKAFEMAVATTIDPALVDSEKEKLLTKASEKVKSFFIISEKAVGDEWWAAFSVELHGQASSLKGDGYEQVLVAEIVWRGGARLSIAGLNQWFHDQKLGEMESFSMKRESWRLKVKTKMLPADLQKSLEIWAAEKASIGVGIETSTEVLPTQP